MEPTGPIVELNDAVNNPATRILEIPLTYGENATQSGVSKLDDSISGTFHVRISEENGYAKITDWLQVR